MNVSVTEYLEEVKEAFNDILGFWSTKAVDENLGGFVGRITYDGQIQQDASKGSVLNSRILWTFAAAYNRYKDPQYMAMAERAYQYVINHFIDKSYKGIYWSVTPEGTPLDTKKQVYAQAFAIYGLSEYYQASGDKAALEKAINLYECIITYSYENIYGGYIEAFTKNWKPISDLRLSEKDANERKTMNTHLHILEAFTGLYKVWPDDGLKMRLVELIDIFNKHIIDKETHHLRLFFNDQWEVQGHIISYGHDIEAAWLLQEAAEAINDGVLITTMKQQALLIAKAAAKGLDEDGGLWHEYDVTKKHLLTQKHWWPQAEAMVGFFNAWQLTKDDQWLQKSWNSWVFIKRNLLDNDGEWFWGVNADDDIMINEDKAGFWKCPYHNGRACMELIERLTHTAVLMDA